MGIIQSIDQLVIVMLENRSFDSMLGYFSLDDWKGTRASPLNGLLTSRLSNGYINPAADGSPRSPFPFASDDLLPGDLPHERWGIMSQLNYDTQRHTFRMDGFVSAQYPQQAPANPSSMGYFTPALIPMTNFLATEFCVCDRWFSAIPADTHPNRFMASSGYTNIDTTGSLTRQHTLLDYLDNLGKRSAVTVYAKRASFYCMLYDFAVEAFLGSERFRRWEAFAADWQAPPTEPHVWILEPAYADSPMCSWMTQGPPDDGHPPAPIALAERFLYDVYTTIIKNPTRWQRTLVVVTYDEHGGFFDHEPALMIPTPPPQPHVYRDFPCTGIRVPTLLLSPYVTRGSTCSRPMDHTSVLRMVADKFAAGVQPPFSPQVGSRPVHSVWDAIDLAVPRQDVPMPGTAPNPPNGTVPENPGSVIGRAFLSALRFTSQTVGKVLS